MRSRTIEDRKPFVKKLIERLPLDLDQKREKVLKNFAHKQLTRVFATAPEIPFDDRSHLIFFSDCHRGDRSAVDGFAKNATLFLDVLQHYYCQGFTYIEVGDGDELWENRSFQTVRAAYEAIFNLFHRFNEGGRLHLLLGNHDITGFRQHWTRKDGLLVGEGLVLKHAPSRRRIFTVHGHQADFTSYRLYFVGRLMVRRIWRRLQMLGLFRDQYAGSWKRIEGRLRTWAKAHQQILICGHTHHPASAATGESPYFNTGSCLKPGELTGLEIVDGAIQAVRWTRAQRAPHIQRVPVGAPQPLHAFSP